MAAHIVDDLAAYDGLPAQTERMAGTPSDPAGPTDDVAGDVPVTIPARMLNELIYCPRLFYLEWVDSQWADNADVIEGQRRHRTVDTPQGDAPLPGEGDLHRVQSVELSSEVLGIAAKLDILERTHGGFVPVDVKKGRPRDDGTAWLPDAVQVCAQALLLREHGYSCDHAEVYYAETRQRVAVLIDQDLVSTTLDAIREAREIAILERPPPPLIASRKCPRCSLVGICLPDETNLLSGELPGRARRLVPADPEARPVYLTEQGTTVGVEGGRLRVTRQHEELVSIRLIDVSHLCLFGNVQTTAQALRVLFGRGVSVFHFSYGGWLLGVSTGLPGKNVTLRIRQVGAAMRRAIEIPRLMMAGKIRNQMVLLRRNARGDIARTLKQLRDLESLATSAAGAAELRGIEGTAARLYFETFPAVLRAAEGLPGPTYGFAGRTRRPPRDAVNCLLSFCYGLLTKEVFAAVLAVGFDPYIGLFHRPRFGRPALVLDLAEEFRPLLADSVTVKMVNNGESRTSHFVVRAGGVALTTEGRRAVIRAWERRMETQVRHPIFGYRISYRRVIEVQARLLAATLVGEIPRYVPFTTR